MTRFAYLIEPPFNHRTSEGTLTGCDVELARTVLEMSGAGPFEAVETEFADLLPGLANRQWRMTTGLFATEERRRSVAFSRPIWALPDGLLVRRGNPLGLAGYRSCARTEGCVLAVVREQIQHRSALEADMPPDRILVRATYEDAVHAVAEGQAHAYASVARAHAAYVGLNPGSELEVVSVGSEEKDPAFGSFAFHPTDEALRSAVDGALGLYLGSAAHRAMMARFGFSDAEIDLIDPRHLHGLQQA